MFSDSLRRFLVWNYLQRQGFSKPYCPQSKGPGGGDNDRKVCRKVEMGGGKQLIQRDIFWGQGREIIKNAIKEVGSFSSRAPKSRSSEVRGGTSLCPTLSRNRDPPISRSLLIPVGPELTTSKGLQRKEPALEIVVYVWPVNRDPTINPASASCCFPPPPHPSPPPPPPPLPPLPSSYSLNHHRPRALLPAQTLPPRPSLSCLPAHSRTSYPFIIYYSGI